MNPVVRLLMLLGFAIAVGGYGVHVYQVRHTEEEARYDLLNLQRQFDERAPAAREIASAQDYSDEMRGLFRWYFGEIRDHDNRFPEQKDHERGWHDIEHKKAAKTIKDGEFDAFSQNHTAVEEVYKLLQTGAYEPAFAGTASGQHFDFWRAQRDQHDGKPMVRLDFVWWGPQRKVMVEKGDTGTMRRTEVSATVQSITFTLLDDKGKTYGEMNGGEPNAKIADPDRYVDLFPSNAVLGTYWLDLFPHEAEKLKLGVTASTRTVQGHEIVAKFDWDLPLKDEWKLAPGQKWEGATEEVRDEDEAPAPAPRHGRKGKGK